MTTPEALRKVTDEKIAAYEKARLVALRFARERTKGIRSTEQASLSSEEFEQRWRAAREQEETAYMDMSAAFKAEADARQPQPSSPARPASPA